MSDDLERFAAELGRSTGGRMARDEYYSDVDPDDLDDVVDDAWMLGATQDAFGDAGHDIHDNDDNRKIAYKAFEEAFLAAFRGSTAAG